MSKPTYTKSQYLSYLDIDFFCRWCGFSIVYDDEADSPEDSVIHMPGEGGYPDYSSAVFGLAQRLAARLYRFASAEPEVTARFGLPDLAPTETITQDMIVNTWADFLCEYASVWEFKDMTSEMSSRSWPSRTEGKTGMERVFGLVYDMICRLGMRLEVVKRGTQKDDPVHHSYLIIVNERSEYDSQEAQIAEAVQLLIGRIFCENDFLRGKGISLVNDAADAETVKRYWAAGAIAQLLRMNRAQEAS